MKIFEIFDDGVEDTDFNSKENLKAKVPKSTIKLILRDCKPFLEQAGRNLAFRGIRGGGKLDDFFKRSVRTDRQPLSTSKEAHEEADAWFNEKFGIKYRSAAVFVSGDFNYAYDYGLGSIFAIFPIGDFKFVWSPKVDDLYMSIKNKKDITKFLNSAKYTNKDLDDALDYGNEVMISCNEYYAVKLKSHDMVRNLFMTLVFGR